jgi:hypothetical protein
MGPEEAAPSILDYRPRSTLVAPTHVVKKARYPVLVLDLTFRSIRVAV